MSENFVTDCHLEMRQYPSRSKLCLLSSFAFTELKIHTMEIKSATELSTRFPNFVELCWFACGDASYTLKQPNSRAPWKVRYLSRSQNHARVELESPHTPRLVSLTAIARHRRMSAVLTRLSTIPYSLPAPIALAAVHSFSK